jgi:error-prone DNA polymerase
MVHPYLRRRKGEEEVVYPHPTLIPVLKKTLGVPIFQEQVMKLAVIAADYTPGEADQLRRDMAAWRSKGRIEQHRERLITRMVEKGVDQAFAERVFSQIEGFGEYGFPESHAASFALLSYVTAWLKRHHPAAFTCAMLDAQPMGFYAPSTLVESAVRSGVVVLPIDVQRSGWDCDLEAHPDSRGGLAIRMGLRYVKGFGEREKEALAPWSPPFESLAHFVRTTALNERALVRLAETGALDAFGRGRRETLWEVRGLAPHARDPLPLTPAPRSVAFPALRAAEVVAWDYRASHHSTRGHPMRAHRDALRGLGHPDARTLGLLPDGHRLAYVGMVICRQRPGTAGGVTFFTLEDETGFVNVVVWRQVFEKYRLIGKTAKLLGVRGKLQVAEGVTHLVAEALFVPDLEGDDVAPSSRDFH